MTENASSGHIPVMLPEVLAALAPRDGATYVDGTFGRGGYSRGLLDAAACTVVAIDRDPDAVAAAQALRAQYEPRLIVIHGAFGQMVPLLEDAGVGLVDGVVLDLGLSSPQVDEPQRGFSFQADGPLDMRMDRVGRSAADIVNETSEEDLARIIREFGEERLARRVARAIVQARGTQPITRTGELATLVRRVVPKSADGIDPATRTFMALRIHVNDEMGEIDRGLAAAERILRPGGRLAVVTFHSLEDRAVKTFLRERSRDTASVSRHIPSPPDQRRPSFRLLERRGRTPEASELRLNRRARSARMRAAERTDAPAWSVATGERPS